jgi:hypothetical protein
LLKDLGSSLDSAVTRVRGKAEPAPAK